MLLLPIKQLPLVVGLSFYKSAQTRVRSMLYVRQRTQGISERWPSLRKVNHQVTSADISSSHVYSAHQIYVALKTDAKEKRDTSVALVRGMDQEFQDQFAKMEVVRRP